MSGIQITFPAEVRTRPDIDDPDSLMVLGVQALRQHPEVDKASYTHDRRRHIVWIHIRVRHAWTPDHAVLVARRALSEALQQAGISASATLRSGPLPPLQLRLADRACWGP